MVTMILMPAVLETKIETEVEMLQQHQLEGTLPLALRAPAAAATHLAPTARASMRAGRHQVPHLRRRNLKAALPAQVRRLLELAATAQPQRRLRHGETLLRALRARRRMSDLGWEQVQQAQRAVSAGLVRLASLASQCLRRYGGRCWGGEAACLRLEASATLFPLRLPVRVLLLAAASMQMGDSAVEERRHQLRQPRHDAATASAPALGPDLVASAGQLMIAPLLCVLC